METQDLIFRTNYFQAIFKYHKQYLEHLFNKNGFNRKEKKITLNESQLEYVNDVMEITLKISEAFKYLELISHFVKNHNNVNRIEGVEIEPSEYIKYHIHNYYIRVSTLIDLFALLINKIYQLGYPPKRLSIYDIFKNTNTKNSEAVLKIKKLNNDLSDAKHLRNLIVHRFEYDDSEIQSLDGMDFLKKKLGESDYLVDYMEDKNQKIVDSKYQEVKKVTDKLAGHCKEIFDVLDQDLNKNLGKLKNT